MLPLFLENGREQHHSLRITSIWIRFLVVLDHRLQRWQKVLVEKLEIHLPLNIDLDKFQDVSSNSLHGFDHVVLTPAVVNQLTDALRVQFVNFDQVCENIRQISQVYLSYGLGNFLVNFDHEIDAFDDFRPHQIVAVSLVSSLNHHLPVLIRVFQKFLEILDLLVLLCGNHKANSFVNLQLLLLL